MLKTFRLDSNEISFEAAKITNLITRMEDIRSNNQKNVYQRNPYKEIENNKSTEVNARG